MKRLSIGVRLTLWYVAIFTLGELVFAAGTWMILRYSLFDLIDDSMESQIEDLGNLLSAQQNSVTPTQIAGQLASIYGREHAGDYLELDDGSGQPVYRSRLLQTQQVKPLHLDEGNQPVFRTQAINGHYVRFAFAKLDINGHTYTVVTGAPADDAVETLQLFRNYLLVFAPLWLLASAGVGYWMSRKALAPVDALVLTARDITGTNLSQRLQTLKTEDELQRLTDTLNEMLDRIESAFQKITQFTADASHELRTPVSLIRTEAELALRRSRTQTEYEDSLRQILHEAERTTQLIEQLLQVARSDSGRESLAMNTLDLTQILRGTVGIWQQVAAARNIEFSTSIPDGEISLMGDQTLLRRLADILLDNAFKYTPSPGSVHLSLELQQETAVIKVQDSGVGIAHEEHQKIFERFYRVDKARSREQGGVGLGLAIAQWIVSQHGGTISVESQQGEGTIFRVNFPLIAVSTSSPVLSA
jgi:heavy metal sensor kinase